MIDKWEKLRTNSSASWEVFLGFVFWDGVSGEQNEGGISEGFWMWERETESSLFTLDFAFQVSALSDQRDLRTDSPVNCADAELSD